MKKMAIRLMAVLLCICIFPISAQGAECLVPVGQVIGLELSDHSVTVASFDETLGKKAQDAGICVGDKLCAIDGKPITCAQDVHEALRTSKGIVTVTVERKGKQIPLRLQPQITSEGPKLGLYLEQGVTGIGTVTWYDPQTGSFGALGHGVNSSDGKLLSMVSGTAYRADVIGIRRGKAGEPGQLQGAVTDGRCLGDIRKNSSQGVFGSVRKGFEGNAIPVAASEEVHTGPAIIFSTISGNQVRQYSVEILKIYSKTRSAGRNMLIRVTDPVLLEATGGIVQGMSGSPIIQDGKLVGAVTHVLVNDPTTGYGIFIENMLDAAA